MSRGIFSHSVPNFFSNGNAQVSANPLTIMAWFYPNSAHWGTIWSVGLSTSNTEYVRLVTNGSGKLQFQVKAGGATYNNIPTNAYNLSTWNFAFAKVGPGGSPAMNSILNGGTQATTLSTAYPASLDQTAIGITNRLTMAAGFDGVISHVGIWNEDLSAVEAGYIYDNLLDFRHIKKGMVSYYELEGTAGLNDMAQEFDFDETGAVPENAEHKILHRAQYNRVGNIAKEIARIE